MPTPLWEWEHNSKGYKNSVSLWFVYEINQLINVLFTCDQNLEIG